MRHGDANDDVAVDGSYYGGVSDDGDFGATCVMSGHFLLRLI